MKNDGGIDVTNVTGAPSTLLLAWKKTRDRVVRYKSALSRNYDRTGGVGGATVRAVASGRRLKPRSGTICDRGPDDRPARPRIDGNCSRMGHLHGFYVGLPGWTDGFVARSSDMTLIVRYAPG